MNVLIVDDEELARKKIRRFLGECGDFSIHEAKNGVEALQLLRELRLDLVFLDIEMPGLNGFEVLQNLEARPFKLIFQTAHDEFAVRAFDENACDYLLKPFDLPRFRRALDRSLQREGKSDLKNLEKTLSRSMEKISVRQGSKVRIVPVAEIEYFTSKDHYTFIHIASEELICELSLSYLEERLNADKFMRIHRNSIVRTDQITAVHGGQNAKVELKSGIKLDVSRARRPKLDTVCSNDSVNIIDV